MLSCTIMFISCASGGDTVTKKNAEAYEYPEVGKKDYVVVGPVIVVSENKNSWGDIQELKQVNALLVAEAKKINGHDIINVRYDITPDGKIIAATAVAIKYKD